MNNKEQIQKLKDNAELAQASYGYFHLIGKKIENDRKKYGDKADKPITLHDILDLTYKGYVTSNHTALINPEKLDGDMSPTQAKRFFSRYDLLEYYPKDNSQGFHACLFQDKESKQYTLAIRGSYDSKDYVADAKMTLGYIPQGQYNDMLRFYNQCKAKYPAMTESKSLNIVGHSLGGALTQMLALSLCDDKNEANINEVYRSLYII